MQERHTKEQNEALFPPSHESDRSPFSMIRMTLTVFRNQFIILSMLTTTVVITSLMQPVLSLDENQYLYFFSTSAQVIAGIFGFLIAGFIFFRGNLEKQSELDESTKEIVEFINKDNFHMFVTVALFGGASILSSLLAINSWLSLNSSLIHLLINFTASLIVVTLAISILFSIELVHPKKIELASNKILRLKGRIKETVSLEDFNLAFNQLELFLTRIANIPALEMNTQYRKGTKYDSLQRLLQREIINYEERSLMVSLFQYRNSIIHSTAKVLVDRRMRDLATDMKVNIEKRLRERGIE